MVKNFISEDDIEQDLLHQLQTRHPYQTLNCYTANPDDLNDGSNRTDKRDVVLRDRLHQACQRLNPDIPEKVITEVVEVIAQRRAAMNDIKANREVYSFIRDGVSVEYQDQHGKKQTALVRPIDFKQPENNQFLAVSQLWIKATGRIPKAQYRRPDVILYINGIPLVFIELKNADVKLRTAYDDNLNNYKNDIPQLFHYNGFCILSNALETKVGSSCASWDYFFNWFRVADEKEPI
ncbi:MAG: type I restriction endonuclease, partial [Merismopediaceae bacterium]|nr:type I restriction endonuclease [Merismopediaceae bacterium]